ncbi:MAG: hypothetical protein GY810_16355 [Aureispira sp.]|nr:hypothetical protein [Aureispira sp.]
MQFEQEIQDLLKSNRPGNNIILLELTQSQWKWSIDKALLYLFDYHWKEKLFALKLEIGPIELSYRLEYTDDGGLTELMWYDIDLELRMFNLNTIIATELLTSNKAWEYEVSKLNKYKYLNNYGDFIRIHFEQQIPIILEQLNY